MTVETRVFAQNRVTTPSVDIEPVTYEDDEPRLFKTFGASILRVLSPRNAFDELRAKVASLTKQEIEPLDTPKASSSPSEETEKFKEWVENSE